jgi:hypothetical protein
LQQEVLFTRLTLDKIEVVGMPLNVASDKRAERDHCEMLCTRVVQCCLHQLARDALTFHLARHLGVDEEDRIPSAPIFGHGKMLIDVGFPALGTFVVFDFQVVNLSICHCDLFRVGCSGLILRHTKMV